MKGRRKEKDVGVKGPISTLIYTKVVGDVVGTSGTHVKNGKM
jgi:hypothetical protein